MESGERDETYFENNGTELEMEKADKTSTSIVNITENGTYTIYAEDDKGNKVVETIDITEIEEKEPEPEPDTTPPTITGVEDGRTYRNYVTPRASDENLAEVTLTRNGNIVEGYTNGDQIKENGNYVLTAIDESGNRTQVSFTIDIEDEDTNSTNNTNTDGNTNNGSTNTNTNTNTGDNTNTSNNNAGGDNTNTSGNTDGNINGNTNNNPQGGTNGPSGSSNSGNTGSSTSEGRQNLQGGTTATGKLPYAGLKNALIIVIIALIGVAGFAYVKYRKYEKF